MSANKPDRRLLVLLVAMVVGLVLQVIRPSNEVPSAAAAPAAPRGAEPKGNEAPVPHAEPLVPTPATGQAEVEDDEAAAAALLARWQAQLAPLFDAGVKPAPATHPPGAALVLSTNVVDAGQPKCRSGRHHFDAVSPPTQVDLIVAVDTSGSMRSRLRDVNRWLRQLEQQLATVTPDIKLIVLVNPVALSSRAQTDWSPGDASTNLPTNVGSNDVLEVLIRQARGGWLERLRPGASVHLVLVTDDNPMPRLEEEFLARLTESAEGRLGSPAAPHFVLHAVLGYWPRSANEVMAASDPVVEKRCAVAPGVPYQRLVKHTGGLRSSLCSPGSLEAFTHALLSQLVQPTTQRSCLLQLPEGARVQSVRTEEGPLREVPSNSWDCTHGNSSYFARGPLLSLCPSTCAALTDAGLDVSVRCEPNP